MGKMFIDCGGPGHLPISEEANIVFLPWLQEQWAGTSWHFPCLCDRSSELGWSSAPWPYPELPLPGSQPCVAGARAVQSGKYRDCVVAAKMSESPNTDCDQNRGEKKKKNQSQSSHDPVISSPKWSPLRPTGPRWLCPACPSECDASWSSQTLKFAKLGAPSPKPDDSTWTKTPHLLRLNPCPLRNAETFEVRGILNRYTFVYLCIFVTLCVCMNWFKYLIASIV